MSDGVDEDEVFECVRFGLILYWLILQYKLDEMKWRASRNRRVSLSFFKASARVRVGSHTMVWHRSHVWQQWTNERTILRGRPFYWSTGWREDD